MSFTFHRQSNWRPKIKKKKFQGELHPTKTEEEDVRGRQKTATPIHHVIRQQEVRGQELFKWLAHTHFKGSDRCPVSVGRKDSGSGVRQHSVLHKFRHSFRTCSNSSSSSANHPSPSRKITVSRQQGRSGRRAGPRDR